MFGEDNAINYTFRMHDARIGRFLSIDPLAGKYPWNSPYAFSENRVIDAVELEGLEQQQAVQTPIEIQPELGSTSVGPDGAFVDSDGVPLDFFEPNGADESVSSSLKPSPSLKVLGWFAFFMTSDMSSNSTGATTSGKQIIEDRKKRDEGDVDLALGLGGLKIPGPGERADPKTNLMTWAHSFLMRNWVTANTYWDRDKISTNPRVNVIHMMDQTIAEGNKIHFRLDGLGLMGTEGAEEDTWSDLPKTAANLRTALDTQGPMEGSFTIFELQKVLNSEKYFQNTVFWLQGQRIPRESVKEFLGY